MQIKSIKLKIVLMSAICLLATTIVLLWLQISFQSRTQTFVTGRVNQLIQEQTKISLQALASSEAGFIQSKLETNIVTARTIASAFKTIRTDKYGLDLRDLFSNILLQVLKDNEEFLGAYSAWEPNALDGRDSLFAGEAQKGHDATGRFVPYWNRDKNGKIAQQVLVGYDDTSKHENGVRKGGWFLNPKERGVENILDPFPYIVQGKKDWLTTMSAPIKQNGKFLGIAGTDLRLNFVQHLCEELAKDLYDGKATVKVISYLGIVVANSANPDTVGQPLSETNYEGWEKVVETTKAGDSFVDLGQGNGLVKAQAPVTLGRTGTPWSVLIEVPRDVVFAEAFALNEAMEKNAAKNVYIGIGAGTTVALIACIVLWLLTGGIVRPIRKAVTFAEAVAEGNLDEHLDVNQADEIGVLAKALEVMVVKLKEMIGQAEEKSKQAAVEAERANVAMKEAHEAKQKAEMAEKEGKLQAAMELEKIVEVVSSASSQLSTQVEVSRQGSDQQTHQVSEVATAMEEMNATVLEVAQNASQASEAAENARVKADQGSNLVGQVLEQLSFVQESSRQTMDDMAVLGEKADDIGKIMDVISDIADQTNLLALNAAIEAARAGDAGRGFAVVADEVRKLAEKTMGATTEVGQAIRGIQEGTRKNIEHVDKANSAIESVANLANQSSGSLNEIVKLSASNSSQISSIATAAEQQSATSEEINRNVGDINRISSETAEAMAQSADAVNKLANQVHILQELITRMKEEGRS